MLKFRYHYLLNTLAYQNGEYWNEISEARQFQGNFGSQGFMLDNGWISFTIYETKIRAFYKEVESPTWFTYYRKDLPRQNEVIFSFTEKDFSWRCPCNNPECGQSEGTWKFKNGVTINETIELDGNAEYEYKLSSYCERDPETQTNWATRARLTISGSGNAKFELWLEEGTKQEERIVKKTTIKEAKKTTSQELDDEELQEKEFENETEIEEELNLNEIEQEQAEQGIGEKSKEREQERETEREQEQETEQETEKEDERETEQEQETEKKREREKEQEKEEENEEETEKEEENEDEQEEEEEL